MGVGRAPISLLVSPSTPSSISHHKLADPKSIPKTHFRNRRLFLLSLPVVTLLLPGIGGKKSSCYAVESFDPVSPVEKEVSSAISRRISEALELLDKGRDLQAQGDFNQALSCFTLVPTSASNFIFYFLFFNVLAGYLFNFEYMYTG